MVIVVIVPQHHLVERLVEVDDGVEVTFHFEIDMIAAKGGHHHLADVLAPGDHRQAGLVECVHHLVHRGARTEGEQRGRRSCARCGQSKASVAERN